MNGYIYKKSVILIVGILGTLFAALALAGDSILRDPTRPPAYKGSLKTSTHGHNITISGIISGKAVIIGKHIFVVGDRIAGLNITAIDTDSITLKSDDGSELKATMPYSTVKLPITKK